MRSPLFAIVVTLVIEPVAAAAAGTVPRASEVVELQKQARAKMRTIEYEHAVPLLERALTAELSRHQKAELNADLGICYASLGDTEHARTAFEGALAADLLLDLPVGTSPKIRRLFEVVRAQGAKAIAQGTTSVVAPSGSAGLRAMPVDFVLSGAVVAGVAAGIITGLISSNAASDLRNDLHDRATVDSLSRQQINYGIASVCAYGLAGAAALSELVVILFVSRRPELANAISVSGAVLPTGGASAAVQVRF